MAATLERLAAALAERYRVIREIGSGGMAAVYLAEDLKLTRQVAIKVLKPELANAIGYERFLRETQIAAQLNHPHVLTIHDSGDADGLLYYVMPFVEGESLRDYLGRVKQLPLDEAIQLTREIADALAYAHSLGIVHRDIKPDNVLLHSGHAVVADFGIARAIAAAGGVSITSTGMTLGTPAYMSPEQATGSTDLDGRCDIYALGCVAYEMLLGHPPFTGSNPQEVLARHSLDPVPGIRTVRDTVPPHVEDAIKKALAKLPADRFATAAQFADAMADDTGTVATVPRQRRAPAYVPWLVGGVLAVAAAVFGLTTLFDGGATAPTEVAGVGVAVLPFRVTAPDADLWREGLADLVSVNIDGIAGLRKIDMRNVLAQWRTLAPDSGAEPDPDLPLRVARATGAGYAVLGAMVGNERRVRLSADVQNAETGEVIGRASAEGSPDSILALIDQLTVEVLRAGLVRSGTDLPTVDLRRATTTSLDAMRSFLQGEQAYRSTVTIAPFGDAIPHFERAVELDSTFAHALQRLANSNGWTGNSDIALDYARRAERFASDLSERDRLFMRGLTQLFELRPEAIQTLKALTARYPDDVEGMSLFADALFHLGGNALEHPALATWAFRRSLELDPYFGPSYVHLFPMVFDEGDTSVIRRLISSRRRLGSDECTDAYETAFNIAWGRPAQRAAARNAVDSLGQTGRFCIWMAFSSSVEYDEHYEEVVEGWRRANDFRRLLERGRVRDARAVLVRIARSGSSSFPSWSLLTWTLLGYPDSATEGISDSILEQSTDPGALFLLGARAARQGDASAVRRVRRVLEANRADSLAAGDSLWAAYHDAYLGALAAFADVEREGTPQAVSQLRIATSALPGAIWTIDISEFLRYEISRHLIRLGEHREAIRYLESLHRNRYELTTLRQLQLARAYEALGEEEQARLHYDRVVRWWENADPELQPWREEARQALVRLTGEPRTG